MATIGVTTDTGSSSSGTTAKSVASQGTAGANGILASGAARLWVASGTVPVQLGVWADSSGAPGALLALSDSVNVSNTSEAEIAFTFSGANLIAIVNGTAYWFGPTWATPGTTMNWSRGATAGAIQTVNAQAPNPFGTPSGLNGPIDAYISHFPAPATDDGAFFEFFNGA